MASPAVTPSGGILDCATHPVDCLGTAITSPITGAANDLFTSICQKFADGATNMLSNFARVFSSLTQFTLDGSGIDKIYALSMTVGFFIAALLLITQVTRMVVTHQGRPLADGLTGLVRYVIAITATLTVAGVLLVLADDLTDFINEQAFGGQAAFAAKLATVFAYDPRDAPVLLLIFGLLGILVVGVLWLEMLFRHAAVLVLIATSPIAASGQVGGDGTSSWWRKFVAATVQLIFLKPVIALVFAIGFSVSGSSTGLQNLLTGLLILLLAVVAWPAIAGLFTFTATQVGAAGGVGAALGFISGKAGSAGGGGGSPQGVSGSGLDSFLASRTAANITAASPASSGGGSAGMAGSGGGLRTLTGPTAAKAGAGSAASAGGGGAAAAAGPAGMALAGVGAAAGALSKVAEHASSGMQNAAHHAGLGGPSAGVTGSAGGQGSSRLAGSSGAQPQGQPGPAGGSAAGAGTAAAATPLSGRPDAADTSQSPVPPVQLPLIAPLPALPVAGEGEQL